jgi:GTP-binding protein
MPSVTPIVAIVGRPNVGKSTLFNRLTGTRAALVSDLPGLTRDRRAGDADLAGHAITLVDTAGLEEAPKGSIAERMRGQSETAIDTADLILFVIDARAGVTPADKTFAARARKSGKPVIVVANKSEGRKGGDGFYEAFALGFGDPVPVSAEHGEGIADLVAEMLAALGFKAVTSTPHRRRGESDEELKADAASVPDAPARPIRVAIVGRPNAGKSTLVNALAGEDRMITGPEPGLTRDAVAIDIAFRDRPIRLFDTAGLRRKAKIHEKAEKLAASDAVRAIRFAEVVVLLVDAEHPLEHQDLIIADMAITEGRALVVAVNKWDIVADRQKKLKDIRETVAEKLAQVPGVPVVTVSALSERGLDKLQDAVLDVHKLWNMRLPTAALNRWLGEAMQRHAAPQSKGRRIKIRYITQPSTRPPSFVAFSSSAPGLPDSYVRYLTNSLRDTFKLPGVPIRFSLRKSENPFD